MQESLTKVQSCLLNYANKYEKEVYYNIGDKIWLSIKNISTDQQFKKLNHTIISLFEIIGKKDISLKLQLL